MPEINISLSRDKFLPVFHHLIDNPYEFDVEYLYGGRDSGKSRHIAMQLIYHCLNEKYFRCLIIRKVLDTVRGSQFQMLCDIIELWGLQTLFRINTSSLEIICINGNGFYGKGLDKVGKIKSFTNPSHCWVEEGNQITSEDFVVIITSMRSNYGRTKMFFSFNPECEITYTDFWLYVEYFSHTEDLSFEWIREFEKPNGEIVQLKIRATHTTYKDNPYVDDLRIAIHESYKNSKTNAYYYQVFTLGLWGYKRPGGVFWKGFEEAKQCVDLKGAKIQEKRQWTYHFVLDNNVNPYITCLVWLVDLQGKALLQIDELMCSHPNNTATKAALKIVDYLQRIEYNDNVYLYGDPSANAKNTIDDEGRSFFDKVIGVIKSAGYNYVDRVGASAPSVSQSGSFINEIFEHNYLGWKIFFDKDCRKTIEDLNMVVEDAEGGILKKNITDKQTGQSYQKYSHASDCIRYFCTTILKDEYQQYLQRRRGVPAPGGVATAQKVKPKLG